MQIAEDWPQGALLTCVGAEDVDAGDNGRVSFELDSTRSDKDLPFRIDAKSGCVFIDSPQPLDFEKRPLYNLTVEVGVSFCQLSMDVLMKMCGAGVGQRSTAVQHDLLAVGGAD